MPAVGAAVTGRQRPRGRDVGARQRQDTPPQARQLLDTGRSPGAVLVPVSPGSRGRGRSDTRYQSSKGRTVLSASETHVSGPSTGFSRRPWRRQKEPQRNTTRGAHRPRGDEAERPGAHCASARVGGKAHGSLSVLAFTDTDAGVLGGSRGGTGAALLPPAPPHPAGTRWGVWGPPGPAAAWNQPHTQPDGVTAHRPPRSRQEDVGDADAQRPGPRRRRRPTRGPGPRATSAGSFNRDAPRTDVQGNVSRSLEMHLSAVPTTTDAGRDVPKDQQTPRVPRDGSAGTGRGPQLGPQEGGPQTRGCVPPKREGADALHRGGPGPRTPQRRCREGQCCGRPRGSRRRGHVGGQETRHGPAGSPATRTQVGNPVRRLGCWETQASGRAPPPPSPTDAFPAASGDQATCEPPGDGPRVCRPRHRGRSRVTDGHAAPGPAGEQGRQLCPLRPAGQPRLDAGGTSTSGVF